MVRSLVSEIDGAGFVSEGFGRWSTEDGLQSTVELLEQLEL